MIPRMNKETVPSDLDYHLPTHANFDIDKLQDELHKFDIHSESFAMDFIKLHVALTHGRISFDVTNLLLEKIYTKEPHPHYYAVRVPLHSSSTLYQDQAQKMKRINNLIQNISIEQIRNPYLEDSYEAMNKVIAKQCTGFNPNERELVHGTRDAAIKGITEDGFDDRRFNRNGAWSHGAYFTDDSRKSHGYIAADTIDQNTCYAL